MKIKILLSEKLGEVRITQAELSRRTGISPNTISKLYNDCAEKISIKDLETICQVLDCDISDLISSENSEKEIEIYLDELDLLVKKMKQAKKTKDMLVFLEKIQLLINDILYYAKGR